MAPALDFIHLRLPQKAVTRVIGVTSVDCMPSADKTVRNRELQWLLLIVWVRELQGTDLM